MNLDQAARMIAAERVKNPGLLDVLRQWAESKYKLPWTHDSLQQLSVFELLVMFWEDYYRKNPIESRRTEDGRVVYANTGDALIDKWEQELAQGLSPDLLEGINPEERRREEEALKKLTKQDKVVRAEGAEKGFSDNYELQNTGLPFLGRG